MKNRAEELADALNRVLSLARGDFQKVIKAVIDLVKTPVIKAPDVRPVELPDVCGCECHGIEHPRYTETDGVKACLDCLCTLCGQWEGNDGG